MPNTSKSIVESIKEYIDWFNKAVLANLKPLIKIDAAIVAPEDIPLSHWEIFNKFILSASFGNVILTASSLIAVLKVTYSAYGLVKGSIQKRQDCLEILSYFRANAANNGQVSISFNLKDFGIEFEANEPINSIVYKLQEKRGNSGKTVENKPEIKRIKQLLSFIHFCQTYPEFAKSIANASGDEKKIAELQKFLEKQVADRRPPLEKTRGTIDKWNDKLVNDWRKIKNKQRSGWRGLVMAILSFLTYMVKPFTWVMGFILGVTAIAALTVVLGVACILVAAVEFCLGFYDLFNNVYNAARKDVGKVQWNKLSVPKKLWAGFCCFFTEGFYGDAAANIAALSAYIILATLLLAGISAPGVVIAFSAVALICGIIALVGRLHKTAGKGKITLSTIATIITEATFILITAGILTALSFVAIVSPPIAAVIVGTSIVCGIGYVGYKWYFRNNNDKKSAEKLTRPSEGEPILQKDDTDRVSADEGYTYTFNIDASVTSSDQRAKPV